MRFPRRAAEAVLLVGALLVAVFLRFDGLGDPGYWLDEALGQQLTTSAASEPLWRWLTGFDPEHGPLYYATQLATRLLGSGEWAGRSAAASFGVATVGLVWWLTRRQFGAVAGLVVTILLAVSPLHVYYSREARPYALLLLLTAGAVLCLFRLADERPDLTPRRRWIAGAAGLLVAMLYSTAVAATVVAAVCLVAALAALVADSTPRRRAYAKVAGLALVLLPLFAVIYAARPAGSPEWPGFRGFDAELLVSLARAFTVTALGTDVRGRTVVGLLLFALLGAAVLIRRDRRAAIIAVGMTVLPLAIALAALKLFDHFYAARYVLPALVGFLLLAAVGIDALTTLLGGRAGAILALGVTAVTAAQTWDSARSEPFRKLDWRRVAATVAAHARPGDAVLAAEPWSDVALRYYLERIPNEPGVLQMPHVPIAERIRHDYPATFVVTAGYEESEMRRWLCGFPMIAASPLENFRLHYLSRDSDFLRERGTPAEQRAASMLNVVRFGEGWAQPEGEFRWAVGTRATLSFASSGARERVLRMRVLPAMAGQTMNAIPLPEEWSEQRLVVPAKDGINTVTLEFARTRVPGGQDQRPLAVAFADVRLEAPAAQAYVTRSAVGVLLEEHTGWRGRRVRVRGPFAPAPTLALLARLGFDPPAVLPRLQRGELHVENLAETVAYGQDCVDDETFLRTAFLVVLERGPYENEREDLFARIAAGTSRPEIVRRIVRSDDFARKYVRLSS